ncbi:acetolactate synthase [Streptomyces sp. NRRL F-5122]|uniref:thiamine pyrophosphate-binding protein n=1 Tax=Streptomyces sp. NRRL F-5122 TaxID=1609098 RepID=UPI0007413418|nr:thiamine pyrophosphate-binding protein [Streptomyces sp. NRRL F-5122]KUJ38773.1 acetolactate synthase [Streptomyces sp. NRRL F-5122]
MSDGFNRQLVPGGRVIARALGAQGVEVVHTSRGSRIGGLHEGCVDEGIEVVHLHNEQAATHAADAHARITGTPGCAAVTAGPGTAAALPGVATASRAQSPLLLIGVQGALPGDGRGTRQDLARIGMPASFTKYAASVVDTAHAVQEVSTALRACHHGEPGPSYLEIPLHVLDAGAASAAPHVSQDELHRAPTRPAADPGTVQRLADLLVHAERPAILLGRQVWTTRATDAAVTLVRSLNIPAYTDGAARGTLPPGDPHHFRLSRLYALANADVIVVVGDAPFDVPRGRGERPGPQATVVRIDHAPRNVGAHQDLGPAIVGDAGEVLASVAQAASGRTGDGAYRRKEWLDELRAAERTAYERRLPQLRSDARPIHPYRLLHEIDDFLTEDSLCITDGGGIALCSEQIVQPRSPGHWLDPGPSGTPGVGIPFVLAAKRARLDKEVVALFGDGALSVTGWDFETLVRLDLPFIGVVADNSAANPPPRAERAGRDGEPAGAGAPLTGLPYDTFARMLGGYGEAVRDPADIAPALRRARASGKPSLLDVRIDPHAYAPGIPNQTVDK